MKNYLPLCKLKAIPITANSIPAITINSTTPLLLNKLASGKPELLMLSAESVIVPAVLPTR